MLHLSQSVIFKCHRLFSLLLLLIFICISTSCNHNNKPSSPKGSQQNRVNAKTLKQAEIVENRYEDIHRNVYENPSAARAQATQLLKKLDPNDLVSKISLLKHIGSSYVFETNYPEGIRYYKEALQIAEQTSLYLQVANINNNLGVIFNETGNYKLAYIHLTEALHNFDLAGTPDKKIGAYNNIGLVYLNLKNFDKALNWFDKALDSAIQPKDTILLVSVLNNIALCHTSGNKPKLALDDLHKAIRLSEKVNNKYGLCISYQLMGNLYLTTGETQKALDAYAVSTAIAQKGNLTYQLAMARIGTSKVLLKLNRDNESLIVAREVMAMADTLNSLVLKSDAHLLMSDIGEQQHDFKSSFLHYRAHIKAQEEIINQTVIHQIYDVELNYLNQQNKMQQLELEKKELAISNKNNLLFFISLLFVMLTVGLYLLYLNHRHRQEVKLQKTIIELTEKKSNAALEAEIRERKRVGQELHDSLGHLLSLAGLHTSVLHQRHDITESKRNELLESLMKIIDDAFDELRNISHNLAPSLLSEQGLKGALKSIADRVNQGTNLNMSFDIYGLKEPMDNLIENTLFRTIQEIVNNTIKHSAATKLFIQLTQGNDEISLMAEDNGKGFNYEEIQTHSSYGLMHMKSRIENLNGTLFIDSSPNRGTIISILIPLSKQEKEKSRPAIADRETNKA